jgi:sigma-E factor negative regulatory protein RseB
MQRLGRPGWQWIVPALLLLALGAPLRAQDRSPSSEADARSPEQWLQLVQQAARRLDYAGTLVYQQGSDVRVSRIVHVFDGQVSHERLQPMDGRPREFIRRADETKCLIPEARRVIVERKGRGESFPGLASSSTAELLKNYAVKIVGTERIAGLECQVLEIQPRQADRYGYRIWVDRGTGLLLRSQTLNERGEVLEQMAFADVRIGNIDRSELKPSWSTEGWKVEEAAHRPVDLREQGWRLVPPSGFKPLYAVLRPMAGGQALQAVYSDGLASLSVFIEPAAATAAHPPLSHGGPINAFVRRVGDSTVTVIGEVPANLARSVAQGAERIGR